MGGTPGVNFSACLTSRATATLLNNRVDNVVGNFGLLGKHIDAPFTRVANGFITADLWTIVNQEIMKQCDALDGLIDAIISEPDDCHPILDHLLCRTGGSLGCANEAQLNALHRIYSQVIGSDGEELFPDSILGQKATGCGGLLWTELSTPPSA